MHLIFWQKSNTKRIETLILLMLIFLLSQTGFSQHVNEQLAKFHEQFDNPHIIKVGERVYHAFGYEYANIAWVIGDEGVIVIDAGWFPGAAKAALKDFRKICQKPTKAIVYTHLHTDHYGGSKVLLDGASEDIPVFGPEDWEKWVNESFTVHRSAIFSRALAQMGALLPKGRENGTVGVGVGPSPRIDGVPYLVKPNISISKPTEFEIEGVRMELMPAKGDLSENLFIWLPDDKTLFVGDIVTGTFPCVESVRFEIDREPQGYIDSYNIALGLEAEFLVPGHGRPLMGKEDVENVLRANRDVTEFLVDQLDRLYVKGYTADEVVDFIKIPPNLVNHPDIQLHYHRLPWMMKTMFLKRGGFVGENMDRATLTQSEESKRLVALLGGPDKVLNAAEEALKNDDPRWAARLATHVLKLEENKQAKDIRIKSFKRIAETTYSANERNYMLTFIKEETTGINWKELFAPGDYLVAKDLDVEVILKMMKARFIAEKADNESFTVEVNISGDNYYYEVHNNVLFYSTKAPEEIDGSLEMERDILNKIIANMTTWSNELKSGGIKVTKGLTVVEKLTGLIE